MQRRRRMWMITVRPVISNLSPNRIRSANRIRTRIPNRTAHAASQITNEKLFPPTLVYIYMRADKRRSAAAAAQSASLRQREFFFSYYLILFSFFAFRYCGCSCCCFYWMPANDRVSLYWQGELTRNTCCTCCHNWALRENTCSNTIFSLVIATKH